MQDLALEVATAVIPVVATIVGGYFARRGWKGRIIGRIITDVVARVAENEVSRMKQASLVTEGKYDLDEAQSELAMEKAKAQVMEDARSVDAGVPKVLKPLAPKIERAVLPKLRERIEDEVQCRKNLVRSRPAWRPKGGR
jgi:hypothetical protein